MEALVVAAGLFVLAFLLQVVTWRLWLPSRQTPALLVLFIVIPIIALAMALGAGVLPISRVDLFRIALLYTATFLAYIVIYSAIENQSPTLRLVSHVRLCGSAGCSDAELVDRFGENTALDDRVASMVRGGWAEFRSDRIVLTGSGRFYANMFALAAKSFGLIAGG